MNISYAVCQSAKFQQAFKTAIASSAGILLSGGGIDSVQIVSTTLVQTVPMKYPNPDIVVKYIIKLPLTTNKTLAADMLYANITAGDAGSFSKILDLNGFGYVKSMVPPVIDLFFSSIPTTRPTTSLPTSAGFDTFSVSQVQKRSLTLQLLRLFRD